jgi:hypothetical protein
MAWRLFFVLLASTLAHGQEVRLECPTGDVKVCVYDAIRASPVKKIPAWREWLERPLEERVGPAPASVVELIAYDNLYHGYPERPRVSEVDPRLQADVVDALARIPAAVKRRLSERVAAIVFVDEFGGTGFTDSIMDERGRKTMAFVVLDPTVLARRTANTWATWKENTPFKPDGHHELKATIERAADDNRRQAIQYILLHELAHALAVTGEFHPDWNLRAAEVPDRRYPFFDLSWTVDRPGNRFLTRFEQELPERKNVAYYFGAKLSASDMVPAYRHLELTNFPTLYAATTPGDDFAESFANYVHVVMMGKPFEIAISRDGKVVQRYAPCWKEARCAAKRRILEEYLR